MIVKVAGDTLDIIPDDDQLARIGIELSAFDGEIGAGAFPLPDPDGDDEYAGGREFVVTENGITVLDGFIAEQDRTRGPQPVTTRETVYTIQDPNRLLHGMRIFERSRPAETTRARVLAFASLDLSGADTTWVLNEITTQLPAKVYSTVGWDELITDIVETTGETVFLHDKHGGGRCLHKHILTSGHGCGLTISDVNGAADDVTVFKPGNPQRRRSPADLAYDVLGRDFSGRTATSTDATSETAHGADGAVFEALVDFDSASQADLDVKTARWLANFKDERDTWTCTIGPLQGALGYMHVGDIITVTSQVMGLTAAQKRIAHISLTVWTGEDGKPAPGFWLAELELGAPKRGTAGRKPRVSPHPVTGFTPGPDILGTVVNGTETWQDAEHQVYADFDSLTGTLDPDATFYFGETNDVAATQRRNTAGYTYSRSFVSHTAPVGASHARIVTDLIPVRHQDAALTSMFFAIRRGTWGASFPDDFSHTGAFTALGETLLSGTVPAAWTAAVGGDEAVIRIPIEFWVPVVDGRVQFVLQTLENTAFANPVQVHTVALNATGTNEPADTGEYAMTFYSSHALGTTGNFVSPVAVGTGNGYRTSWFTPFAYKAGSLVVTVDGIEQEVAETDPDLGSFTLPFAPASGAVVRASFVIASPTETGLPIAETGGQVGPVPGSDIQDVAGTEGAGDNDAYARDDHVHRGVTSVAKFGSAAIYGAVTLSEGTDVTITQSGQNITISATGGSGSGGWTSVAGGTKLEAGRTEVYDANELASIVLNGFIEIRSDAEHIYLIPPATKLVIVDGGVGFVLPRLTADPASPMDGQLHYDEVVDVIRLRANAAWRTVATHTHVVSETPSGTINGSNAAFTIAATPATGTLRLYKNGLRQRAGAGNDYTLSGSTITYEAGNVPQTGDSHVADYET